MASTVSACRNGSPAAVYAVSISAYEPACSSVTQVFMAYVPVPPPDTTSPPTSACAIASLAMHSSVSRARSATSGSIMRWPS